DDPAQEGRSAERTRQRLEKRPGWLRQMLVDTLKLAPRRTRLAQPTTSLFAVQPTAAGLATVRRRTLRAARRGSPARTSGYTEHGSLLEGNVDCYLHCTKKAPLLRDASTKGRSRTKKL